VQPDHHQNAHGQQQEVLVHLKYQYLQHQDLQQMVKKQGYTHGQTPIKNQGRVKGEEQEAQQREKMTHQN
jgi:hypothetical protein